LRKTYAASGNIARNISNNQRISRAGYNVTQNLARSLKVDSSLLLSPISEIEGVTQLLAEV